MAKNELLEPGDDRKTKREGDVAVFGGLRGILRLEKALKEGEGVEAATVAGKMGLGKKGSFANWLKAQDLQSTGKDADTVWNETGWFQHPIDKKWRMEISDAPAKLDFAKFLNLTDEDMVTRMIKHLDEKNSFLKNKFKERGMNVPESELDRTLYNEAATGDWQWADSVNKEIKEKFPLPSDPKLGDVLEHPELYNVYPELRNLRIEQELDPRYAGGFYEGAKKIAIKPSGDGGGVRGPLSTTLHETQHAVQSIEDFERGFNPSIVSDEWVSGMEDFFKNAPPDKLSDDDFLALMTEFIDDPKYYGYKSAIGEVEARNVELRNAIRTMGRREEVMANPLESMGVRPIDQFTVNELLKGFDQK